MGLVGNCEGGETDGTICRSFEISLSLKTFTLVNPVLSRLKAQVSSLFFSVAVLISLAFLPSCSTRMGKEYVNTTARYNSYFLAKEKMKEVDLALKAKMKDDYHVILSLHYPSDTNFGKSQSALLEDVFKYSSWCVRFYKTSKWVDNAYILIGKVRQYQGNYKDGLETFKYVNSTSPDINDRHLCLIQMMKFFTDFKELDNVKYIIDFLDQEERLMTKKNKRNYLIAKASYYQNVLDYQKVHLLLDTVLPMCRRKHDKARLAFINGQVCEYLKEEATEKKQTLDFDADKAAYKDYGITVGANPKYELWFNAEMNRMRVSPFSDLKDQQKARKYYDKLLADLKNADFKDRIYYDFAGFERKLKNYDKAQEYYKLSVKNANNNQRQKAYSYLALAEMYYDDQQRFEDAKLYYDSTIAILPKDFKGYNKSFRRQRILKEFVEHLTTVRREDSLQRLAKMDSVTLDKFLDDYKAKEERRLKEQAEKLAKAAKKNRTSESDSPFANSFVDSNQINKANTSLPGQSFGQSSPLFYFYNKEGALQGQLEFQAKWGRRKLDDYWRVSSIEVEDLEGQKPAVPDSLKGKDSTLALSKNPSVKGGSKEKDQETAITVDKKELYNTIPLTPEKLQASNDKLQASLFKLGKIYSQHLNEPDNSIKSLERLINDFPENENLAEAHYMIYLIAKGKDSTLSESHKAILLEKYPDSRFAKLLRNPNYLAEDRQRNKQIMERYKAAYQVYLSGAYHEADSLFTLIQTDYPNSDYDPKIELVRAIMIGRQGKKQEYDTELNSYLEKYKKGTYHDYAQALKTKVETERNRKLNSEETGFVEDTLKAPGTAPSPTDTTGGTKNTGLEPGSPSAQPTVAPMPEEIRKMQEERMRNRGNRGMLPTPQAPPTPVPSQDTSGAKSPKTVGSTPNPVVPPSPAPAPTPLDTNRKGF